MIKKILCKKTIFSLTITLLLIFFILLTSITFVSAQSDFTVILGNSINDSNIDGVIGNEWDDVTSYTTIEISPQGTAQIWIKHDQTHLFIAVQFEADSNNPWVALQLGDINCMTSNTDGAIFGHDDLSPNGYQDIYFGGFGIITSDTSQDGNGAIEISNSNTVTIELKKPLNTQDSDGRDIQWSENNTYAIIIMWDSNGGGSSGGNTGHTANSPNIKTIYLEPQTIPPSPTPTTSPSPTQSPTPSPEPTTPPPDFLPPEALYAIVILAVGIALGVVILILKKGKKIKN
jgi:spore coat protein U-like protein